MVIKKPPELKVKNFDVILTTHNNLELTIKSIKALYAFTTVPFHLIVVDDSTDLTPLYIERLQKEHNNITLIHSSEPYKEGNQLFNIGLKHAKYDFVATVMNSVMVEPDWERVALQFMYEHPEVGIVGLKQLLPWGRIESAGIAFDGYRPIDLGRDHPGHRFVALFERDAVAWALAILRKEAVNGNLPEGIYHPFKGWDDIDNCFVLREKGFKVYYCGYGCGIHETRATRGSDTEEAINLNKQNCETFCKRWGLWEQYLKSTAGDERAKYVEVPKVNRAERRRQTRGSK